MDKELKEQFEDFSELGHGALSRVYKVKSKKDGNYYALKIMNFKIEDEPKEYSNFKNEVKILKQLKHDQIVKVIDEIVLDAKPAIQMEFIEGKTLASLIKDKKYFTSDEVLEFARQMSAALLYCHCHLIPTNKVGLESDHQLQWQHAVIHNDISTKNIIRAKDETGKYRYVLVDFGLSFSNPDFVRNSIKENGMCEYKSPEKWELKEVSTPTDIYSFGIVLFELLAGTPPFPCDNYNNAVQVANCENMHKYGALPDLWKQRKSIMEKVDNMSSEEPDYPYWLQRMIEKCLEKDPAFRFKNGQELNNYYHDGIKNKLQTEWPEIDSESKNEAKNVIKQYDETDSAGPIIETASNSLKPRQSFKLNLSIKKTAIVLSIALLLFVCWIFVPRLFKSSQNGFVDPTSQTVLVRKYFMEDGKVLTPSDIEKIKPFLRFPLDYYNEKGLTESEFTLFIEQSLKGVTRKIIILDSLVAINESNLIIVRAYGTIKVDKVNQVQKTSSIRDEFFIVDNKIVKVVRLKK